ncbi:MAG: nitrate reductase molybdenum cofactor assembly chaperone [Micrococcales bacterium]|nr:nitrate reductase molybdenum cofactor assembly chaperone [Micrococcales bacterium]
MTFGPLPVHVRESGRQRRPDAPVPGRRDVLALASLMLEYPDDELCDLRAGLSEAVASLPRSASATDLRRFCTWFEATEPAVLRVEYVRTFDHRLRNALYVTFAPYGDTRSRGSALAGFRRRYHEAGLVESEGELPDYLPTVLQFAAQAEDGPAGEALDEARTGIETIELSLSTRRSPYAGVLRAVRRCLPPGRPRERLRVVPGGEAESDGCACPTHLRTEGAST